LLSDIQRRGPGASLIIATPEPQLISEAMSRFENSMPSNLPLALHAVSGVLAPAIGRLGYAAIQRGEFSDALTLDANYIRRSDAELQLKGK
jgi:hypothetical protein